MDKYAEKINIEVDESYALKRAVEIFKEGGIFIYPTDTIYGFGCNPFNEAAMDRLNSLKSRDAEKQYILLINSIESLHKFSDTSKKTLEVLNKIWPASVSVVLNLNIEMKEKLNHSTAAFRIPNNRFCLNLLDRIKLPLISTSVNIKNEQPITNYASITNSKFTRIVDAILYSPVDRNALASTVIDLTGNKPVVLREGQINFMELWEKFT